MLPECMPTLVNLDVCQCICIIEIDNGPLLGALPDIQVLFLLVQAALLGAPLPLPVRMQVSPRGFYTWWLKSAACCHAHNIVLLCTCLCYQSCGTCSDNLFSVLVHVLPTTMFSEAKLGGWWFSKGMTIHHPGLGSHSTSWPNWMTRMTH